MKDFEALEKLVSDAKADAEKFYNGGNSSAGTRLRKAMLEIKNTAQKIRVGVQETKNSK